MRSGELFTMYANCCSEASSLADIAFLSVMIFFCTSAFLTVFVKSANSKGFLR